MMVGGRGSDLGSCQRWICRALPPTLDGSREGHRPSKVGVARLQWQRRASGGRGSGMGRLPAQAVGVWVPPPMQVSACSPHPRVGLHPAAPGAERTGFIGSRNLGITLLESDQPKIVKNQNIRSSNPA